MSAPRRPPPPLPVTVLTGFLGAGKTTLLNEWARSGALADTAVLINEFGEIALDHLLVEQIDGDTVLLASGCVCCTVRGDLVSALENLLRRLDNGRIEPFSRLVIETSGLADPVPILQTFGAHPYLALRFRIAQVLTLVDAVHGLDTLARYPQARRQVALADTVLLTKTDLPGIDAPALRKEIAALNPTALIRDRGEDGPDECFAPQPARSRFRAEPAAPEGGPGHGETIRAVCLTRDDPLAPAALDMFLRLLQQSYGARLLRAKGLVALSDEPARPVVVHAVQHVLHRPVRLEGWPDDDRRTRLVVIVDGADPAHIQSLFAACCGEIAPDRPDAAALRDNPLAPQRTGLLA